MVSLLAVILALQLVQGSYSIDEYETVIAVTSSTHSELNPDCLNGSHFQYSIDELPSNISNGTLLRFCSNSIVLKRNMALSDANRIAFVGFEFTKLTCIDGSGVGIELSNIQDLEINNIAIEACGRVASIDTYPYRNVKASLIIQNSVNINLRNVTITSSPGTGLALFYNSGSIEIIDSIFERSGLDGQTGGNGVYVETGPSTYIVSDSPANYDIRNCSFLNNSAVTGKDSTIKGFSRFDKGGGLCMYVRGSENVEIDITDSLFIGNQAQKYGGGLFVAYNGKCTNNTVIVSKTEFRTNTAKYGGAVYSGYLHSRYPNFVTPQNSSLRFVFVNFIDNRAEYGGGFSLFSTKTPNQDSNDKVRLENCYLTENSGQYGAAVALLPNAWNINTPGYLPTPVFVNCSFTKNVVMRKQLSNIGQYYNEYSKGSGAFNCFNHRVHFEENTIFENNIGTAMFLDSCVSIFKTNSFTRFENNTGYQGGAVYELSSVIFISDGSTLRFNGNTADDKGGAIYEHTSSMLIYHYSKTCFIDYNEDRTEVADRNITVSFRDNYAGRYGHSIYASSLSPCYNRFSFTASDLSMDIFNQVGNFTYSPAGRIKELATAANHSNVTDENWSGHLSFIPGNEMELPIVDIDDFGQDVQMSYLVTIENHGDANVSSNHYNSEISSHKILLFGKENDKATVTLSDTSPRQNAVSFQITMLPCPPGFILDRVSMECICSFNTDETYVGIDNCNLTLHRAYSKKGYWFGYKNNQTENEDSLISGYCPSGFCSTGGERRLLPGTANREELNEIMCSYSRSGTLCGRCTDTSSVYYHSMQFKCESDSLCHLGWLFYILSELIPVTIVFLLIMFLNITFTSGLVNGFIFYSQVIEVVRLLSSDLIRSSPTIKFINNIYSLIYSSFSLDFFFHDNLSYCLWKTSKAIDMVAFKYVTLLYAFCLVIFITVILKKCTMKCCYSYKLSRYFSWLTKYFSFHGNIIHALSAFLILCYAQCAQSSVLLLTSVTVYNKGSNLYKTLVYYDGEIEWFSVEHLPYALPAIFLSIFVLILPPILLIIYPLHNKVLSLLRISETKCVQFLFRPLDKLKPFFDSFQGCFKDEFRFFSGLYFIYRFFIMFNVLYNYLQDSFFFIEIQLLLMLVVHAVCQPYKKRLHNIIDTLLFGNLAVIIAITYYNLTYSNTLSATNIDVTGLSVVSCILIILPIVVAVCILVYAFCVKKCWMKVRAQRKEGIDMIEIDNDEFPDRGVYESFEKF